jgi:hypothetical protein
MSDRTESKMRELTYKLIAMAPEAPPFPEEDMVQVKPAPTPAPPIRPRRRSFGWALAAAAAVFVLIGGPLLLFNLAESDDVTGPSTTVAPPTTAVPTPAPSPVVIAVPGAEATTDGVEVVDGVTAIGDDAGGLVVHRDLGFVDDGEGRVIQEETIRRIAADGTETMLLTAMELEGMGPVSFRLQDVALIDGTTQAVVVVRYGSEYPDVFEEIWFIDLGTGRTETVYQMVAVESTISRVSVANGTMLLSESFEGGTTFVFLDTAGQPIDVAGPYAGVTIGSPEYPELVTQAVLAPGDSTFAYVEVADIQTFQDGFIDVAIVVWDLAAGVEVGRTEIQLRDGAWPGRMDYDGTSAVLGRQDLADGSPFTPLHIPSLETGDVTELDVAGTPSLRK